MEIYKLPLDYSKALELGKYEPHPLADQGSDNPYSHYILHIDKEWVYIHRSVYGEYKSSEIIKVKNDGSGEVEVHKYTDNNPDSNASLRKALHRTPIIAGERMFYSEGWWNEDETGKEQYATAILSIDLNFQEEPVVVVPGRNGYRIDSMSVTDDYIYYSIEDSSTAWVGSKFAIKNLSADIMRVNLDGSNPTVLAEGFGEGSIPDIQIAGDWMMFRHVFGGTIDRYYIVHNQKSTSYLMRLDGTGLHKLGEPFIPEDAPGIVDSTGKWRYEILKDGTAAILGAGSKLKFTGKLDIPKAVDKIPVTAIGENAFYGYDGFTSVTIPKSVTSIGDYAFFFCKGLTGVTIPEGVIHIGEGAFQYCEPVKKVSLPASLASIGGQAFANCPVAKFTVDKKNEVFAVVDGVLFDKVRDVPVE